MKKLFSLIACLLCTAILVTTAFAATPNDAYTIYKNASDSLNNAKSVEMYGISKTSVKMDGADISETNQNITIKMLDPSGKMKMEAHTTETETNQTIDMYYKDGYMYQNTGTQKFKTKLDIEDAVASSGSFDATLTEDFFKDAIVEQTPDGTKIRYSVDFNELKNNDDIPILDEITKTLPDAKINMGKVYYTMLVGPDNMLKGYTVSFNMTINYQGMEIKASNNTGYAIVSIDKVSSISFPADLDSYKLA